MFDQDDETGEDLTHIYNKVTNKHMKLKRVGKVWILDVTVAAKTLLRIGWFSAGQVLELKLSAYKTLKG